MIKVTKDDLLDSYAALNEPLHDGRLIVAFKRDAIEDVLVMILRLIEKEDIFEIDSGG